MLLSLHVELSTLQAQSSSLGFPGVETCAPRRGVTSPQGIEPCPARTNSAVCVVILIRPMPFGEAAVTPPPEAALAVLYPLAMRRRSTGVSRSALLGGGLNLEIEAVI
jgi:hypothetical protein